MVMHRFLKSVWRNRGSLAVLVLAVLAAGVFALKTLPESVFPNVDFPRVSVVISARELPVHYMLIRVTRPIQNVVKGVPGVSAVRSQTGVGLSKLHIYFDATVNPHLAYLMVQARLAQVKLPPKAHLTVRLMTPHIKPFAQYALVSNQVSSSQMMPFYAFHLRPAILSVRGVYRTTDVGRGWPEVHVRLDPRKLAAHHVTVASVIAALKTTQGPFYAGLMRAYHRQFLLVVHARPGSARLLSRLEIRLPVQGDDGQGILLPLGSLGSVVVAPPPATESAIVSGYKHALLIDVEAQAGANVKNVAVRVKNQIRVIQRSLPSHVRLIRIYDFSRMVVNSLNDVWIALGIGAVLACLVVLAFLRRTDVALATLIVVPISLAGTFLILKSLGFGLNIMTLGGITAAIGALIDHAIVVMERSLHPPSLNAGVEERREYALRQAGKILPVMSLATLTSVIVFLPLIFMSGTLGLLFRNMALAIVIALLVSQLAALTVTPVLAAYMGLRSRSLLRARWRGFRRLRVLYVRFLRAGMDQPWIGVVGLLGLVCVGVVTGFSLKTAFLPHWDQGAIAVPFRTPVGTSVQGTAAAARTLAAVAMRNGSVARVSAVVGRSLENPRATANKGDLVVMLKSGLSSDTDVVMTQLRRAFRGAEPDLTELKLHQVMSNRLENLSGSHAPLEVLVFGSNPSRLLTFAARLTKRIRSSKEFVSTTLKSPSAGGEIAIEARNRARLFGLRPRDIARQLLAETRGKQVGFLLRGEQILPIRVTVSEPNQRPNRIGRFPIWLPDGMITTLGHVARTRMIGSVPYVTYDNLVPYAYIEVKPAARYGLSQAASILRGMVRSSEVPSGVNVSVGGYYRQQSRGFDQMAAILAAAVLMLLVLLGFQFSSLKAAVAALAGLSVAGAGVFLALWVTQTRLDSTAFLGLLLVLAIATNNLILIFALAHRWDGGGTRSKSVEWSTRTRLRPIVMTMLADVLGFLPIAVGIGHGTDLLKPLAISVMGGLTFALLGSVWLAPVLFAGLDRIKGRGTWVRVRSKNSDDQV